MIRQVSNKQIAVGYCRVSTIGQKDGLSLSDQKSQIKNYCKEKGFELLHIYTEQASGKTDERTEFRKMLGNAAQQRFSILVVSDNDRFGRNVEDRLRIRTTLTDDFQVELHSIADGIFKNTPTGRFTDTIKSSVSEYYRDLQVEKSASALSHKLTAKAERNIGHLLYGLTWSKDKKSAIKHPDEYPLLRKVVDFRFKKKLSFQAIAQKMNENGHSYRGRIWDYHKVRYILSLNSKKYTEGKGTINFQDQTFRYSFPPLISKVELAKLQNITPDYIVNGKKKPVYMLSQKLVCGLCGSSLYHNVIANKYKGKRKSYSYYTCKNKMENKGNRCQLPSIPQKWIEEEVWENLRHLFKNQKHFEKVLFATNKQLQKQTEELNQIDDKFVEIEKVLSDIKQKIEQIIDFVAEGTINKEIARTKVEKLEKKAVKLEKEKKELEAQELLLHKEVDSLSVLEETRMWWWERAETIKPKEKRVLVEALVDNVIVWPFDPKLVDEDESRMPAKVHVEIKGHIPLFYKSHKKKSPQPAALYRDSPSACR